MANLSELKAFPVMSASVALWVFKKRSLKGSAPIFTGRWAELGDDLAVAMKQTMIGEIARIEETIDYGLLAQNNEGSSLAISVAETHAETVRLSAAAESNERRLVKSDGLNNALFYAVKFSQEDEVLWGIKKTDASWRTRKKRGTIPFTFVDNTLVLDDNPSFNLSRYFDFIILKEDIFVRDKAAFESVLEYKTAHQDDFVALCAEHDFEAAFVDLEELKKFVGSNKIQLRRMAAIHTKKHYKNVVFMRNLRKNFHEAGLNINFDEHGKIIPCENTCRDIFQALLDFRLFSRFSSNVYDVPDTSAPRAGCPQAEAYPELVRYR